MEEADGDQSRRQTLDEVPRPSCVNPSEGNPAVHAGQKHVDRPRVGAPVVNAPVRKDQLSIDLL